MTAREYLGQARKLMMHIRQKEKLLAEMRLNAVGGRSLDPDGERVQTSRKEGSPLEEAAIRRMDLEREIQKDIVAYYGKRNEIIDTIHGLDDSRYILVLHAKWIDGESLERIAADTHYYFGTIRKWYWNAMKEMERLLKGAGF